MQNFNSRTESEIQMRKTCFHLFNREGRITDAILDVIIYLFKDSLLHRYICQIFNIVPEGIN